MSTLLFVVVLVVFLVVGFLAMPRKSADEAKPDAPEPELEEQDDERSALGEMLAAHDLEGLKALLAEEQNLSLAAVDDMPPLHAAIALGFLEAVPLLIEHGAAIDFVEPQLGSALSLAIALKHWAIVKVLLDAKVPLDLVNEGGAHALHVAAYVGATETVRKLLDRGAPLHQPNFQGGTALRAAAAAGHIETVRLLLERGAEIGHVDIFGESEIDAAHAGGHAAVVTLLRAATQPPTMRRTRGSAPFASLLPSRKDALVQQLRDAAQRGALLNEVALSSVEAPSIVHIAKEIFPNITLMMPTDDIPDPRKAFRNVAFQLWRYEAQDAHVVAPERDEDQMSRVMLLALIPYLQHVWSTGAALLASDIEVSGLPSLLVLMARPPTELLERLEPWDAWFRSQVATAFIASYVGDEPWAQSKRRELLYEVLDGPADWANTAVIVALVDVARRDESAREDIIKKLFETARRPVCPPIFQHIVQPAAWALDELGEEKAREEFREIIAAF